MPYQKAQGVEFSGPHVSPDDFEGCVTAEYEAGFHTETDGHVSGTVYKRRFDSFVSFIDYCDRKPPNGRPSKLSSLKVEERDGSNRFCHFDQWDEARDVAQNGWPEGRKRVLDLKDEITTGDLNTDGERIDHEYGAFGQRMEMGRYQAGDPECWVSRRTVHDKYGTGDISVTMNVNVSASGSTSRETFSIRGAAAAAAAEVLEFMGVSVEINAVETSSTSDDDVAAYEVPIKRRTEPLNPDVLAFQLSNPDMLRRLMFAALEQDDDHIWNRMYNYGTPADLDEHREGDAIYIESVSAFDNWSTDRAKRWVRDMLEDQGIDLDAE
jgi:hypothetical protein